MIDIEKYHHLLSCYKNSFYKHWKDEKSKWVAIKCFQDNWNIDAVDFAEMFKTATKNADYLLTSVSTFPRGMIIDFAKADAEVTRSMFRTLFDESLDLAFRVDAFRKASDEIQSKYGENRWKNHFQNTNAISTYLWLQYPDKYYIYKYKVYRSAAESLGSDYKPKSDGSVDSMICGYHFYDEVCTELQKDEELRKLVREALILSPECYADPELRTLTVDFGFYMSTYYPIEQKKKAELSQNPANYNKLIQFQWIDFYTRFATKLLEYKKDRQTLIEKIQRTFQNINIPLPKLESDGNPIDIDPFTVFGLLNKKDEHRKTIIKGLISEFSMDAEVPDDFSGVPYNPHLMQPFYAFKEKRNDDDIDNLWGIFESAIEYEDKNNIDHYNRFCELYDLVIAQPNIKWTLTTGLYWIRPYSYINLDYPTRNYLKNSENIESDIASEINLRTVSSGEKYLDLRDKCLTAFASGIYPCTSFPDLTNKAWNISNSLMEGDISENYLPLQEPTPMTINSLFSKNLILYGPPGTGKTYNAVNYAVAICESRKFDEVQKESYQEVLSRYNKLKDEGRIAFTTFHQSYGYEEFIEGIRPITNSEDASKLEYEIKSGLFKKFCERAREIKSTAIAQIKEHPRIWGMILGGTGMTALKKQCFSNNEIRLGWSEVKDEDIEGELFGDEQTSWNAKHMVYDFKNSMEVGDIVVIEKNNKSIDAIGVITGEYVNDETQNNYPRSRSVEWLVKDIDKNMVPFFPNGRKQLSRFSLFAFDYIGMDVISQIINEYKDDSMLDVETETKPYVFIIDEINRGNISKIFGELITLIEATKRAGAEEAMEAKLPYSGELFSIPQNVYILGTMNTADRSIALLDTALRRRFDFIEMMPDTNLLRGTIVKDKESDVTVKIDTMLDKINKRIEILYDREHMIGHAYFMKLKHEPTLDNLQEIFLNRIIPLLQEYFYDDYERIQLVLGDNDKDNSYKFIRGEDVIFRDFFKGNPGNEDFEGKKIYWINKEAFSKINSYRQIYE